MHQMNHAGGRHWHELCHILQDPRIVVGLFLGSGMSLGARNKKGQRLPSWSQLLKELCDEIPRPGAKEDAKRELDCHNFLKTAEICAKNIPHYRSWLRDRFDIPDQVEGSGIAKHKALFQLFFGPVLTTNYDLLAEIAHGQLGLGHLAPYTHRSDEANLGTLGVTQGPYVLHLHGAANDARSIILAQTDYEKLQHEKRAFWELVKTMLLSRTFLFLGYGYEDEDIDRLIKQITTMFEYGNPGHFIFLPSKYENTAKHEILIERNIKPIWYETVDSDHTGLTILLKKLVEMSRGTTLWRFSKTRTRQLVEFRDAEIAKDELDRIIGKSRKIDIFEPRGLGIGVERSTPISRLQELRRDGRLCLLKAGTDKGRLRILLVDAQSPWNFYYFLTERLLDREEIHRRLVEEWEPSTQAVSQFVEGLRESCRNADIYPLRVIKREWPLWRLVLTENGGLVTPLGGASRVSDNPCFLITDPTSALYLTFVRHFEYLWHCCSSQYHAPSQISQPERSAGAVVITKRGNGRFFVLLLRSANDMFVFPKGHIRRNEEAIDAALRELVEEAGIISVRCLDFLCTVYHPGETEEKKPVDYWLFQYIGLRLPEILVDEVHKEGLWVSIEQLDNYALQYEQDCQVVGKLREWLRKRNKLVY